MAAQLHEVSGMLLYAKMDEATLPDNEYQMSGNEKDDSFKGSIGNIYQSFAGKDVYSFSINSEFFPLN